MGPSIRIASVLVGLAVALPAQSPVAAPAVDPVEGHWLGKVTTPDGDSAEFGLRFWRRTDGRLVCGLHLPIMHVQGGAPISLVTKDGGTYVLDGAKETVTLGDDGRSMTGTFAFSRMRFRLERVEGLPEAKAKARVESPRGPAPVWSRTLGAAAWASPVVQGGVIYLGTADGKLHAIAASDGEPLWTWTCDAALYGSTLATDDALFVVDERHRLHRIDRASGEPVWMQALDASLATAAAPADSTYNHRTPVPVLFDGLLYVGASDGVLRALDPADGTERWRFDSGSKFFASAAVTAEGVYAGAFDGNVFALDRANGEERWRTKTLDAISSAPLVVGDTVVAGSRDYLMYGLAQKDGATLWSRHFWFSWVESTPRLDDDALLVGSSDLRAVRAIDSKNGHVRWSTDVPGLTWGTPLRIGETVYAGTAGQTGVLIEHHAALVALDRRSGALRWTTPLDEPKGASVFGCVSSLAESNGMVVACTVDGTLAVYPLR